MSSTTLAISPPSWFTTGRSITTASLSVLKPPKAKPAMTVIPRGRMIIQTTAILSLTNSRISFIAMCSSFFMGLLPL